jgi:predicted solute-binding protein
MIRLAAPHYLNTLPLTYFLGHELSRLAPSQISAEMKCGNVQVGLVPSVTFLQEPSWHPLWDAGILGSWGPVDSVLLVAPAGTSLSSLTHIRLSEESETSNHLMLLIWKQYWNLHSIEFIDAKSTDKLPSDAVLGEVIIGNKALEVQQSCVRWDLALEWRHWHDLPFVFALWASTEPVSSQLHHDLKQARLRGLSDLERLSRQVSGLDPARLLDYWQNKLLYEVSEPVMQSLSRFQDQLLKAQLLPNKRFWVAA